VNEDSTKETMRLPESWIARADGETTGGLTAYIKAIQKRRPWQLNESEARYVDLSRSG